jgi:hypothetical protein
MRIKALEAARRRARGAGSASKGRASTKGMRKVTVEVRPAAGAAARTASGLDRRRPAGPFFGRRAGRPPPCLTPAPTPTPPLTPPTPRPHPSPHSQGLARRPARRGAREDCAPQAGQIHEVTVCGGGVRGLRDRYVGEGRRLAGAAGADAGGRAGAQRPPPPLCRPSPARAPSILFEFENRRDAGNDSYYSFQAGGEAGAGEPPRGGGRRARGRRTGGAPACTPPPFPRPRLGASRALIPLSRPPKTTHPSPGRVPGHVQHQQDDGAAGPRGDAAGGVPGRGDWGGPGVWGVGGPGREGAGGRGGRARGQACRRRCRRSTGRGAGGGAWRVGKALGWQHRSAVQ